MVVLKDTMNQANLPLHLLEVKFSAGYAYNIPYTTIHIGANAKLISSTLENYNSLGGAIDIGAIFIDERNDVNWG
jgi:hypothetical protein